MILFVSDESRYDLMDDEYLDTVVRILDLE